MKLKAKLVPTHSHGEAYCLMQYKTDDGELEVIWNSRDGVTPFIILSKDGKEMQHVNWEEDIYAPLHIPKVGDRIFVDATPEVVKDEAINHVEKYWSNKPYPMSDIFSSKEEAIKKFIEDWTKDGSPWLITVNEKLERINDRPKGSSGTLPASS